MDKDFDPNLYNGKYGKIWDEMGICDERLHLRINNIPYMTYC